jgi:hypothetical protein
MHSVRQYRSIARSWLGCALLFALLPARADGIPAFARKYRTTCRTCHTMPPRLNPFGDAFRLNGYQMPQGDAELVRDEPQPMGAPEWRDLFPNAIWPGTIPGGPPVALRIIADYETRSHGISNFQFPTLLEIMTGGTLGDGIGFFATAALVPGVGAVVGQAFAKFQDPLRVAGLPPRMLNVWVGKLDQNLLPSFRNLDRIYRNSPLWTDRRVSDLGVDSAGTDRSSPTLYRPQDFQPGIELNGILRRRLAYSIGLAQGVDANRDVDNHKDIYYAVRAKLGGRAFDGTLAGAPPDSSRPSASPWIDHAIQVEHFGYFGRQGRDDFRRLGVAVRSTRGPVDAAIGYVWGSNDRPWSSPGGAEMRTWFVRGDYTIFPWLLGSLRVEDLRLTPRLPAGWEVTPGREQNLQRISPAVVMLVHVNMRITLEGELYTRDASVARDQRRNAFWTRLDFAF